MYLVILIYEIYGLYKFLFTIIDFSRQDLIGISSNTVIST